MNKIVKYVSLGIFSLLSFNSSAAVINLSDYLGVPSGSTTYTGDGVYSNVVNPSSWGFGADVAGSWVGDNDPFTFNTGGTETTYLKGIGAHPTQTGSADLIFNLDAFRADGYELDSFTSVIGIDLHGGPYFGDPNNGANFSVFLDNVLVYTQDVAGTNAGSFAVDVGIDDIHSTLTLSTSMVGAWNSNHAAWALAQLNGTATSVPEPSVIALFGAGLIGVGFSRRKRMIQA